MKIKSFVGVRHISSLPEKNIEITLNIVQRMVLFQVFVFLNLSGKKEKCLLLLPALILRYQLFLIVGLSGSAATLLNKH